MIDLPQLAKALGKGWSTGPIADAATAVLEAEQIQWCLIHNEPDWLIDCLSNSDLCDLVPRVMLEVVPLIENGTGVTE